MLDSNAVRAIIQAVVKGIDVSEVGDDQDFAEAGIDSLDHSMILFTVEEKCGIKIPDEAVSSCASVAGIVSYVEAHAE